MISWQTEGDLLITGELASPRAELLLWDFTSDPCFLLSVMRGIVSHSQNMLSNCGAGEDSWESLGQQRQSILKEINPGHHWKGWCWSSNTLSTRRKEPTHWKRPWCWERLKTGGEEDDKGWDGWTASSTQWTWVWGSFRSYWWAGKPGILQFMGL